MRIGHGYDVHKFEKGRKLILGGVKIPYEMGLLGHSDADVLVHAIMDAMLGAAAMGDIGKHFPDTDDKYKDADSMKLLEKVNNMISEKGYTVGNIDYTIIAQRPKLSKYIDNMIDNIKNVLNIDKDCINIKATTEEGLGFTGSMQGMAAHAVCILNNERREKID